MDDLDQGEIKLTKCGFDGDIITNDECDPHFFVILTKRKYNSNAFCVLAVPITHKPDTLDSLNYGIDLTNDEITDFEFDNKHSYVLCNRVTQLNIEKKFKINQDKFYPEKGRIVKSKLDSIKSRVERFIRTSE